MTKKLDEKTRTKLVNYLESRFGIDKNFFDNYLFTISGQSVSILSFSKENKRTIEKLLNTNYVVSFGLEIFSNYKNYVPSSLGFSFFPAEKIKQNSVEITREQAKNYFSGKNISVSEIKKKSLLSSGFVACVFGDQVIGTARFDNEKQIITPNLSFVNEKTK